MKNNISLTTVLTLLFFCFVPDGAFGQWNKVPGENRGRPLLKNYSYREYKGHNQVWAITQDKRGIMYFGNTDFGILEYDGSNWRAIPVANQSVVRSLDVDDKNRIFVGAAGELGYLDRIGGDVRYVSLVGSIPQEHRKFKDVFDTLVTSHGVYFRTHRAIYRWFDGTMRVILPHKGSAFEHRAREVHGKVYVYQKDRGLFVIEDGRLSEIPGGGRFADGTVNVMLPFDDFKTMLLVSEKQGVFLYDGKSFTPFENEANEFVKKNWIYSGAVLGNELFALGTYKGVAIIDRNGELKYFLDKSSGLIDHDTLYIFVDRQNGLWLAFNNGIARVNLPDPLSVYNEFHGISSSVNSVARHDGKIFVATAVELFRQSDNPAHPKETFELIPGESTEYWKLLSTGTELLVGTYGGVFLVDRGKRKRIAQDDLGVVETLIHSVRHPDRIYAGCRIGIGILLKTGDEWICVGKIPGIESEVWNLTEDGDGVLWAGSRVEGVLRIDFANGEIRRLGPESGLPVGSIAVSHVSGRIRAATTRGLFYYDPAAGNFTPDKTFGEKFADSNMFFNQPLIEDSEGIVWIRYGKEKKIAAAFPKFDGSYELYEKPFGELAGIAMDTIYIEENGVAWFGGPEGLFRYNPEITQNYTADFHTIIRNVKINTEGLPSFETFKNDLVLPYAKNDIRFEFAATNFRCESHNMFQVWLEGGKYKDYSEWENQNFIEYPFLPEGEYMFHVKSKNIYGWVGREDYYRFAILPPWYKTVWAYAAYAVLLLLAAGGTAFAYGLRIKRKAEIELRKKEEELSIKQQFLQASSRFVPSEFLRHLDRPSIVEVTLGDCVYQNMSILFSDLRSFTTMSENMSPEDNFRFLNSYLGTISPVIREHNGFIDKYIGDAIMALFDKEADDAVIAGIEMLERLREYNKTIETGPLRIGIGIHTGPMMMGTIGEEHRMETTVISDVVNMASRLEGMTKMYGTDLLISEHVYNSLKESSRFKIREIDRVAAKGKLEPVTIFEVYDAGLPETVELKDASKQDFEEGLSAYRKMRFKDAKDRFGKILTKFPNDKATRVYLNRTCRHLENEGLEDWDGVTRLDVK